MGDTSKPEKWEYNSDRGGEYNKNNNNNNNNNTKKNETKSQGHNYRGNWASVQLKTEHQLFCV
jgi:hypothetical protein